MNWSPGTLAQRFRADFEDLLASTESVPSALKDYALAGKQLRPALCLALAEGLEVDYEVIRGSAIGLELIHCAALLHDDVLDGHDVRRQRPTIRGALGTRAAIILGDLALGLAFQVSHRCTADLLGNAAARLARASYAELSGPGTLGKDAWTHLAAEKTSTLFEAAVLLPLCFGEEQLGLREPLETFGRNLGLGFQLQNDLEDFRLSVAEGRLRGDLAGRRPNLALALGMPDYLRSPYLDDPRLDEQAFLKRLLEVGFENQVVLASQRFYDLALVATQRLNPATAEPLRVYLETFRSIRESMPEAPQKT